MTLVITDPHRPALQNAYRRWHWRKQRDFDAETRMLWRMLAYQQRLPKNLGPSTVRVIHERPNRAAMPDLGACTPTAKAAIDGLVDYGLWPDDSPQWVTAYSYDVAVTGRHAITIEITENQT